MTDGNQKSVTFQVFNPVRLSDLQIKEQIRINVLRLQSIDLYEIKYRSLSELRRIFLNLESLSNEAARRKRLPIHSLDNMNEMQKIFGYEKENSTV
ncbi:MAG: hypothetical protein AAF717_22790 [Bacteroidota bacterium]